MKLIIVTLILVTGLLLIIQLKAEIEAVEGLRENLYEAKHNS